MLGKTHLYTGLACGIVVERTQALLAAITVVQSDGATEEIVRYALFDSPPITIGPLTIPSLLLSYGAVALGSLLPDMDEPNSMAANLPRQVSSGLSRYLSGRGLESIVRAAIHLFLWPLNGLSRLLAQSIRLLSGGHRAATHRLITAIVVSAIASLIGWAIELSSLGLWLFLGYLSHLILDLMTRSGLALWEPFSSRKVHLLPVRIRIRTGNLADRVLGWLALSLGIGYAVVATALPFLMLASKAAEVAGS